jgi:fructose-1,6-bisphosphatase-3
LQLVQHEPFQSRQQAIEEGVDIKSTHFLVEFDSKRMMVRDTDIGCQLQTQVDDLKRLLQAYRLGIIK